MRRLFFSLLAMSFMGVVVGCQATHGVCDCGCDIDNACAYREPWVNETVPPKTDAPAPAPLPEIKETLPTPPKK